MAEQYLRQAIVRATNKTGLQRVFSGLRVTFDVEKSESSNANKGKVNIYNLSELSRAFIEDDEVKIELECGYKGLAGTGQTEILFVGNIGTGGDGKVFSERQGQDWVTTFECGDGEKQLNNTHTELSFAQGVPFTAIINQLISSFGLAVGSVQPVGEAVALNGFTASGKTKDVLDKLAKRFGFNWSVQNNAVQITRESLPTPEIAVSLTPYTGLISNIKKREKGIEFRALLNPQITPGRAVVITGTKEVTAGTFKVTKAQFKGDTHGGDWEVAVEALPLI